MSELLTIGEFAARCGLSRSALRFYDQNDLLPPRLVDDETGYRYYAVEQLELAALVRRLRSAEMPVGVLRRYLAAGAEDRGAILDAHLASFRERATAVEAVVEELRRDLAAAAYGDVRWCSVAPAQFASALEQVAFAIGDPEVRAELEAVWVESKEDSLRVVATDSYRLAVRDLVPEQIGGADVRGVLEAAHAAALAAQLRSAARLVISQDTDGVINATIDGHRATVGHSGEGFPDYESILAGLPTGHQIALPRDALRHSLAELPNGAPHLTLGFEPEHLVLNALGHQATVAGSWSGPALNVLLDVRFFTEAVHAMVGPDLVIEASDALHPIILRSADTGTFSVLTMPIRPAGPVRRLEPSPRRQPPDPVLGPRGRALRGAGASASRAAPEEVRRELSRMLSSAIVTRRAPDWLPGEDDAVAYLLVGDICLPLRAGRRMGDLYAVTAICRGTIPEATRERRNRARSSRTAGRRAGKLAGRGRLEPVPPPDAGEWD